MTISGEPGTATAADGVIDAVRKLAPTIIELAPVIERERKLPSELVEAMRAAGAFHTVLAEDLGGLGCSPVTAARVVEELAAADGSAGWCSMIASQNTSFAGFVPPDVARQVWGNGQIACGTARPTGRALVTNDPEPGYVVSGRWPFASGSSHADWFGAECTVYEGDSPKLDPDGNAVTRMLMVPRDQVTLYDTWDTTGLRGTASNDFEVKGVFVPETRGFQMLVTPPMHPWVYYRLSPLWFINHGSQALGVARGALDCAAEVAATKSGYGSDRPLREHPKMQYFYAEARVSFESARHYLYSVSGELWTKGLAGDPGDALLRARVRLANSHALAASVHTVDVLHTGLGTASLFAKTRIERQFRDIHTAAAHVMIGPLTYEAAGRVELGEEAQFPFF